ncbi:MAG: hypothetical protein LKJ76_01090 [Lachnospiraceae bacterium]|jgi:hypothetical protein|nr:hypothetical protein [Lachnospiraceae bacterium]
MRIGKTEALFAAVMLSIAAAFGTCKTDIQAAGSKAKGPQIYITIGTQSNGVTTIYEDFGKSSLFYLYDSGLWKCVSPEPDKCRSGLYKRSGDFTELYAGNYEITNWVIYPADDVVEGFEDQSPFFFVSDVYATESGTAGEQDAESEGGEINEVAVSSTSALGKEAMKLYKQGKEDRAAALRADPCLPKSTYFCEIEKGAKLGSLTMMGVNREVWIDGTDTALLSLYSIDPASVSNDYAIADTDRRSEALILGNNAKYSIIAYDDNDATAPTKPVATDQKGFLSALKKNGGSMDVNITTDGYEITAIEQVYEP